MAEESPPLRAEIKLDLSKSVRIAQIGVRRAAAFLKLALELDTLPAPKDLTLNAAMNYQFWPSPVSPKLGEKLKEEFLAWIVGSCLRELDLHYALFLDDAWRTLELSKWHGKTVHSSTVLPRDLRFESDTNVSNKLFRISEIIGEEFNSVHFKSLSHARNALAHGAGYVRQRDANADGILNVSWLVWETFIIDGTEEVVFHNAVDEGYRVRSPDGAKVEARLRTRSLEFRVGTKLVLPAPSLAEICSFYSRHADYVHLGLSNYLKSLGIKPEEEAAESG